MLRDDGRTLPRLAVCKGIFVGGERLMRAEGGTIHAGQMYTLCMVPEDLRYETPIIMIHGGGGQGTDFLTTPDGRPGWAFRFLDAGYAVYVVDRPGHGRSPFHADALGPMSGLPTYEDVAKRFTGSASLGDWPEAGLHTQWPDDGTIGSPTLDQMMSSCGPMNAALATVNDLARQAGAALLDLVGPSVLLTHSMGGPCGWVMADARPELIRGIVACEPVSPPFLSHPLGKLEWGITASPLAFEPIPSDPADLRDGTPRTLKNLTGFPIGIVTAEASWMASQNHLVVDFLRDHGVDVEHVRLEEHGIHGNGHMMVSEMNSDTIADLIIDWVGRHIPA